MTDFKSLNLAAPLDSALEKLGYTTPTPIQLRAIPDVLKGRDLMGIAQTGTGKTAAFALPVLNHIASDDKDPPKRGARALVLAPTRELASQIAVSFRDYGSQMPHLSVTAVFGGASIKSQIKKTVSGNDVIVATPGRLMDLVEQKALTLKDVEILVLDEADQMMDMGFIHALKKIIPMLPKERQTLFFSATMVPTIAKLAGQFLTNPVKVSVTPANKTADRVEQRVTFVNQAEKQGLLALSLLEPDVARALVFTRTKHGADRVVKRLAQVGIDSLAIHGNKSQGQRQRALAAFREGEVHVLVATDVAARGIDIEGISHVFNFEIPNVPEQYVHRIGRTARASAAGVAHAFVSKEERPYLKDIQKLLKTEIPVVTLPDDFTNKAAKLKSRPAIVKPKAPKQEARKGRGKSRKKSRNYKDKREYSEAGNAPGKPQGKPRQTTKNKSGESRADRKAKNQAAHAKEHTRKPKKMSGANTDNPRSRVANPNPSKPKTSGHDPQSFRRKPNQGGKPGGKPSGNRDGKPGGYNGAKGGKSHGQGRKGGHKGGSGGRPPNKGGNR